MVSKMGINGENALKFFGNMTASISHEVKNVLAIINENAGLLGDLCIMAEKGLPIDPGRIKAAAEKVIKQVQRGDIIINRLNKFAHSVDEPDCDYNVNDLLVFVSELSERIALMSGIKLETNRTTDPVIINTNPFLFETLIWFFLDYAMNVVVGKEKTICITAEKNYDNVVITFSKLKGLSGIQADEFPGEREKSLLTALNGITAIDADSEKIMIKL